MFMKCYKYGKMPNKNHLDMDCVCVSNIYIHNNIQQ